jgi:hypothetical protein
MDFNQVVSALRLIGWVRIASGVQSWQEAHSRINGRPPRDCTPEAMGAKASPDLCAGLR